MVLNPDYDPETENAEWEVLPNEVQEQEQITTTTDDNVEPAVAATTTTNMVENEEDDLNLKVNVDTGDEEQQEEEEEVDAVMNTSEETTPLMETKEEEKEGTTNTMNAERSVEGDSSSPSPQPNDNDQSSSSSPGTVGGIASVFGAATKLMNDLDKKHNIKRKTRNSLLTVQESARNVGKTIGTEADRGIKKVEASARNVESIIDSKTKHVTDQIHKVYVDNGIEQKAKTVATNVTTKAQQVGSTAKDVAISAGSKAKQFNDEYKVTDKLVGAAVVGSALLLAKGNFKTGAAVLATGGAAYMANEAMNAPYRHDSELNEHVHME